MPAFLPDELIVEEIETMPETCVLDVADEGGATYNRIGDLMGVTRERVRQIVQPLDGNFSERYIMRGVRKMAHVRRFFEPLQEFYYR